VLEKRLKERKSQAKFQERMNLLESARKEDEVRHNAAGFPRSLFCGVLCFVLFTKCKTTQKMLQFKLRRSEESVLFLSVLCTNDGTKQTVLQAILPRNKGTCVLLWFWGCSVY